MADGRANTTTRSNALISMLAGSDIAAIAAHNPADHRIVRKIQFADLSLRRRGVGFRNEFEHFGITSGQALDRLYIGIHREAEDVARR